jgi:hypothetical protein
MADVRAASLPAPVGGWDVLNAIADMPAENAVRLDNWFCEPDRVETRGGYTTHVTGFTDTVDTLFAYRPPSGGDRLAAAAGGSIFDATTAGTVGTAIAIGFTSARWQYVQVTTAGGHFILAVNGSDAPILYNGSVVTAASITGPTPANLAWISLHQRRVWTGERNSLVAWYLAPNAIAGAAVQFDLTSVATLGGSITTMATWSRDGGAGADDTAVFITSEGEALIYAGTDPSSLATWALQGVFRIGRPLGRRCVVKFGADLCVFTEDGIILLSQILPVDASQRSAAAISRQINAAVTAAAREYGSSFGWEPFLYPARNMAIFNVPAAYGAFDQFVFNTITRGPSRFTGVPARCWGLIGGLPYFGSTNSVCLFDNGALDNGASINAVAVQAPNAFGSRPQKKMFRRVQPILRAAGAPSFGVDIALDYRTFATLPGVVVADASDLLWDGARWDSGTWLDLILIDEMRGVRGIGRTGAVRLVVETGVAGRVAWVGTNVLYVPGGLL